MHARTPCNRRRLVVVSSTYTAAADRCICDEKRSAPDLTHHVETACVLRQHSWVNVHDLPPLSAVVDTARTAKDRIISDGFTGGRGKDRARKNFRRDLTKFLKYKKLILYYIVYILD